MIQVVDFIELTSMFYHPRYVSSIKSTGYKNLKKKLKKARKVVYKRSIIAYIYTVH